MGASLSVTLSGRVLEGIVAEAAWPRVAALLRMSGEDFAARVQPRLPLTLKATTAEFAQRQEQALRQIGIEAVALPEDGPRALLRNGETLRGPVSAAWLRHALDTGDVDPGTEVRGDDAPEWQRADVWLAAGGVRLDLDEMPADMTDSATREAAVPPLSAPVATPADPSADQPSDPASTPSPSGFWRRIAAWFRKPRRPPVPDE